jgi:hypothetical protein
MQHLKYIGLVSMHPFKCTTCDKLSKQKYLIRPNPAIIHLMDDRRWRQICKNCARREVGSKNKKGWDKLHANA